MIKKMLGVFTSVIAALVVVGVAWAGTDDGTSTSVTAATETAADVSVDDSSASADAAMESSSSAAADSSASAATEASTSAAVEASTSSSVEGDAPSTTSTSLDSSSTTSTTADSTTSTSVDDSDDRSPPDGVTTHLIPGVGTVTIEINAGQMILVDVTAPGWNVEHDKLESDRIELELTNALQAEAEFEARINDGRVEVRIEVD